MKRLGQKPETLYISTACYSENTNLMLKELRERIGASKKNPYQISYWEPTAGPFEWLSDLIREQQKIVDRYVMDALLYSVPKYTITPDGCKCEWSIDLGPDFTDKPRLKDLYFKYIQPYETNAICKLETEETKMDAKKCERCGKLYEMQDADPYMTVYFPGLSVSDYSKENFSESRIRKDNTRIISVNSRSGQVIDLCPECREKLKNFFESGKDETTVIKKAEEN